MKLADRYTGLTKPLQTERRVELLVLVLVALLAVQVLVGTYRAIFPPVPEAVLPTADAMALKDLAVMDTVAPEARAEIRERPLFWVSRRPVDAVAPTVEQSEKAAKKGGEPQKIEGLKLAGVFGSGEAAGIIVLAKDKKHRVTVGQEIKGWKLQSVGTSEALFTSSGREARLALKRGTIAFTEVSADTASGAEEAASTSAEVAAPSDTKTAATAPKPAAKKQPGRKSAERNDSLSLGGGDRGSK